MGGDYILQLSQRRLPDDIHKVERTAPVDCRAREGPPRSPNFPGCRMRVGLRKRTEPPRFNAGGPACSNHFALDLTVLQMSPDLETLPCHCRGPCGPPCSQNNQKHHTKNGLWLRSRRNRIAPTSSWGPAPASPHEPSRISRRQKSLLSCELVHSGKGGPEYFAVN